MDRKLNFKFILHMTAVPNSGNHPNNRIGSVDSGSRLNSHINFCSFKKIKKVFLDKHLNFNNVFTECA